MGSPLVGVALVVLITSLLCQGLAVPALVVLGCGLILFMWLEFCRFVSGGLPGRKFARLPAVCCCGDASLGFP